MKVLKFKYAIGILALFTSMQVFAGAEGKGGGDICEKRIQQIRDDIQSWIAKGGYKELKNLPVPYENYKEQMLDVLATQKNPDGSISETTDIECVSGPVDVDHHEKICRFDNNSSGLKITCDFQKFLDKDTMSDDDQYRIVHHEYAGLAGLERPNGGQSEYIISKQIAAFLEFHLVKSLVVKPLRSNHTPGYVRGNNSYCYDADEHDAPIGYPSENVQDQSCAVGYVRGANSYCFYADEHNEPIGYPSDNVQNQLCSVGYVRGANSYCFYADEHNEPIGYPSDNVQNQLCQ